MHTIVTGLRGQKSPDWGGWGGRYVRVRENAWLESGTCEAGYAYPEGRWYSRTSAWGRSSLRRGLNDNRGSPAAGVLQADVALGCRRTAK